MSKDLQTDLKFYPFIMTNSIENVLPGAYSGECFKAKSMQDMCKMTVESPYINYRSR